MQILALLMVFSLLPPVPGRITPDLIPVMENAAPGEKITVIVHMNTEYPYAAVESMHYTEICEVFKNVAENSQKDIVKFIRSLPDDQAEMGGQFWIFNGFHVKATKEVIRELARRDDVWFICNNGTAHIIAEKSKDNYPLVAEWNIQKIQADSCWSAGFSGSGIILGQIDTGVLTTHAALAGKWLSPYWLDGVNGQSTPYDDYGHGTHTMGTICGGDGYGAFTDDVGVAYGAQYIPTKAFDSGGSGQYAWIDTCYQYLANLKAGGIDIRAIGNSWSGGGSDLHFWTYTLNWKTLGILPVFSNGNSGPGAGTVGAPASYPLSLGVGSTNSSDAVSTYSSRGPAPNINPINDPTYWYYPTWNLLKPDVSAPGENVRSAYNNGGYTTMSGTSMASPHVTGGTAVLLQKNPALTVTELYDLFRDYCDQPAGYTYPNYDYGWGRINLWRSLQAIPAGSVPNVIITRTVVTGGNGNGQLDPGENAGIVNYLRNNGSVMATNTNGTLRTADAYVTISDSTFNFGNIASGDSANNSGDPFDVTVSASCPNGHAAAFNLYIVCAESSWTRSFNLVIGTPGLDYATHDVGNCKLSVTRYGAIGFMSSAGTQGMGFVYPSSGVNHIFYSGFAAGNSASYCVDRYYESTNVDDADWNTTTDPDGTVHMYEPWQNNIDEYATAGYDDSGHPTPQGLVCEQYSWAWDDATANDFVIMKFVLRNDGSSTISNLDAAVFVDWDIGDYMNNQGSSEAARNLTWMYETTPYVGVEILDPPRTTPARNLSFIDHDAYIYPYGGLPDNYQIQFMDGTINLPASTYAYDWSTCNSAGPFTLAPAGTQIAAFAIIGGNNLSDLQANADTAYNRYWNWTEVQEGTQPKFIAKMSVLPVISTGHFDLQYSLSGFSPLNIRVFDASGRMVEERSLNPPAKTGSLGIDLGDAPQGIYFITMESGNQTSTEKVIKLH